MNAHIDSVIAAFDRAERTAYAAETAAFTLERMLAIYSGQYDEAEYLTIAEEIRAEYNARRAKLEEKRTKFRERMGIPLNPESEYNRGRMPSERDGNDHYQVDDSPT
jgi:hypothetical protein